MNAKELSYTIEPMKAFQLIGFEREFHENTSYQEIPKFWEEISRNYFMPLFAGKTPASEIEKQVCACMIGQYGVCFDEDMTDGVFRYLIAGTWQGGKAPDGLSLITFPEMDWAKFPCKGPIPTALQTVNTAVFTQWLPGNPDYELTMGASLEWYAQGDSTSPNYQSAIWLPVKKKAA